MTGRPANPVGTCHACDPFSRRRCQATFTCKSCGRSDLNVCRERVGRQRICVHCWEAETFGPGWSLAWDRATKHRRSPGAVEAQVQVAVEYQKRAAALREQEEA